MIRNPQSRCARQLLSKGAINKAVYIAVPLCFTSFSKEVARQSRDGGLSEKRGDIMSNKALQLLDENFGRDTLIALATSEYNIPTVRIVNTYYENGCFYTVTHNSTNKMKQIEKNPVVSICSEQWFTAQGVAENLGYICDPQNEILINKLRKVFAEWYYNGHTNEADPNTCILRINLTKGVFYHNGERFEFDFTIKNNG